MTRFLASCCFLMGVLFVQASLATAQEHGTIVGFGPPELEPRPPNGIAALVVGGVLIGAGAESFVLMAFCDGGGVLFDSERTCLTLGGTLGAVSVTAGIAVLTVGVIRRKKYKVWRHTRTAQTLESLRLTPLAAGGAVSWSARF